MNNYATLFACFNTKLSSIIWTKSRLRSAYTQSIRRGGRHRLPFNVNETWRAYQYQHGHCISIMNSRVARNGMETESPQPNYQIYFHMRTCSRTHTMQADNRNNMDMIRRSNGNGISFSVIDLVGQQETHCYRGCCSSVFHSTRSKWRINSLQKLYRY